MDKVKLSVVIITKNEEHNIKDCLESVKWADDIVVVDDMSKDRTVEIVRGYTERIFSRKMDIEGRHRNLAYDRARHAWILSLDADERVTQELKQEIIGIINSSSEHKAFSIPRKNYIGNYWVKYGGLYPAAQLKLFQKEYFRWEEAEVHPMPILSGSCGLLRADLIHYSYLNFDHFIKKVNGQTTLEAAKWFRDKRKMSQGKALWRAFDRFMRSYFRKKGYKDGFIGFMVAFCSSLYQVLSYAKYFELVNNKLNSSLAGRRMMICPCCNNSDWVEAYSIKAWIIEKCSVCGFAKIDPLPTVESRPDFFSEEKVVGDNTKKLTLSQKISRGMKKLFKQVSHRDKSEIFLGKISQSLPKGSAVLDIGCGDGSFMRLAERKGYKCTGIEISAYLAGLSKGKGLKTLTGNFLSHDFGDQKFDGITLISLLEHLDDPELAIKKCFSLLNDKGVLFLKTVNYACLNRFIRGGDWTGFRPPDHIVYFTPTNLKRLLKKHGFNKINFSAWAFNDNMYCDAIK